jgi:hypothetical protein
MVGGGGIILRARHGGRLVDHQLRLQRAAGQPAAQYRHQRQPVHAVCARASSSAGASAAAADPPAAITPNRRELRRAGEHE